ncbi:DEAD/DEAH box helicase [Compostibacter hankyongensis]|uniref:Non-specific serine/threonine protein kinase n=1 Tax=Compostibacter hankyongensis TaxID=1007089 RepID=A0ABP8G0L9_9BACT
MPLPQLIKYVYNNGTDEVIRRGKLIFSTGGVTLLQADPLLKTASFRVKSDTHANFYKVTVNKYHEANGLSVRCQCPYNLGDICRHEAAALFQLQDMLDKHMLEEKEAHFDQRHTVVKMKTIDLRALKLLTSQQIFSEAERMARHHQATINSAKDECVEATLIYELQTYSLIIKRNEERNFDTHCTCDESRYLLCKHKTALLLQLLNAHGPYYFDTLRNWDKEKNKLLALYGYSLQDDLEGKFAFSYVNGKPFLRVLDPAIKKVNQPPAGPPPEAVETAPASRQRIGVVFSAGTAYPWCQTELISGETDESQSRFLPPVQQLDLSKYVDYYRFPPEDRELITPVRKLQSSEVNRYLNKNSPFAGIWDNIYQDDGEELPAETKDLILEYFHPKLKRLLAQLDGSHATYWLPPGEAFRTASLRQITVSAIAARPVFRAQMVKNGVEISCQVAIPDETVDISANECPSPLLFLYRKRLYGFSSQQDAAVVEPFLREGVRRISRADWPAYLEKELLPLSKRYTLHFDEKLKQDIRDVQPRNAVRLKELGETLLIQPLFLYEGQEAEWDDHTELWTQQDGVIRRIRRQKDAEEDFIRQLRELHPNFRQATNHRYFYLRTKEALSHNWFFNFFDALKAADAQVFGYDTLKHFRFNTHRPETRLRISSNIDWFDAEVDLLYGNQHVSIRDVKKALQHKQNYVQLADGTLGMLPEEWLRKYGLFFRMGDESGKGLRLSKYNFGVIDELYEHIDDDTVLLELEEKRRRLLKADELEPAALPENVQVTLRPYQESGFHWLNYLDKIGWGGILADDMGLGKTVQALIFLQHYKNNNGRCLTLVVCPTTLIYNWENEIRKFTPQLQHHIHHGPARNYDPEELRRYDIIITTYGTLRSDIQLFTSLEFDYVILDESQAIKNPHSKVTKAAQLLRAHNRLALSGTPMQNNTFDIYAQMNFLNPGMLGSVDFFRNEFATPIDRFQDEERKTHLRKLIYPFLLRRTKEQVARDLPERTEMVLFCEMDPEQRHIYDTFRNAYRAKILGTIDDIGIARSQLTILQGLVKLRQICDSPSILNEPDAYPTHSVKLHELTRELQENTGDHKVLVFSQFLGMLSLIRERLQKLHIPYEYFDGSTSSADRVKAIDNFQANESCRVFLISLKAGGVGLNLTAADYVYIVDPWWNPAVEQQAIDRTHRIGQTKNIFAYRMICKDSVEEKILQLQDKKKTLVKDIIADDAGFVKKLTREDVLYLFS